LLETTAQAFEALRFRNVWAYDHAMVAWESTRPSLECWTTLAVAAAVTRRIRVGPLVLGNHFRNPALVAKQAATLDVLSGGRLEFGIGAGWDAAECRSYGLRFPPPRKRVAMLGEAVRLIRRLWTEQDLSVTGEFYSLEGAVCAPRPLQQPHPPIWIGGDRPGLLRLMAMEADIANLNTDLEGFRREAAQLDRFAAGAGGRQVPKSAFVRVLIDETPEACEDTFGAVISGPLRGMLRLRSPQEIRRRWVMGTPEQCIEQLQAYADAGAEHLIIGFVCRRGFEMRRVEIFAERVIPGVH
jgi:alkanesulfonate monooxygenase SsuD/methylene tetrahydromethanopterin reductase-like flavin-dependent oxidoreductase (luciferase family)